MVTRMMQPTPNSRLSIAEVMGHPWFQGETATHDEIRANFTQRQKAVDEANARQSHQQQNAPGAPARRAASTKDIV